MKKTLFNIFIPVVFSTFIYAMVFCISASAHGYEITFPIFDYEEASALVRMFNTSFLIVSIWLGLGAGYRFTSWVNRRGQPKKLQDTPL